MKTQTNKLLTRAAQIIAELDERNALYKELDSIVQTLRAESFESAVLDGTQFRLRDNFAEKNTVFRPAGVKRFELEVEALGESVPKRRLK